MLQSCFCNFSFVEAMRALRRKRLIEALKAGGEQLEKVVEQLDKAREAAVQAELAGVCILVFARAYARVLVPMACECPRKMIAAVAHDYP